MGNLKPHEGILALYHYLSVRIPLAKIWMLFNFTQNRTQKPKVQGELTISHVPGAHCTQYQEHISSCNTELIPRSLVSQSSQA